MIHLSHRTVPALVAAVVLCISQGALAKGPSFVCRGGEPTWFGTTSGTHVILSAPDLEYSAKSVFMAYGGQWHSSGGAFRIQDQDHQAYVFGVQQCVDDMIGDPNRFGGIFDLGDKGLFRGCCKTARQASVAGVAKNDVLNMRRAADSGAPIVTRVPPNAKGIGVARCNKDWCYAFYLGYRGWLAKRYLSMP